MCWSSNRSSMALATQRSCVRFPATPSTQWIFLQIKASGKCNWLEEINKLTRKHHNHNRNLIRTFHNTSEWWNFTCMFLFNEKKPQHIRKKSYGLTSISNLQSVSNWSIKYRSVEKYRLPLIVDIFLLIPCKHFLHILVSFHNADHFFPIECLYAFRLDLASYICNRVKVKIKSLRRLMSFTFSPIQWEVYFHYLSKKRLSV